MYNLQKALCVISGMSAVTLQPAAGAHGELTGMMIVKKYFEKWQDNNFVKTYNDTLLDYYITKNNINDNKKNRIKKFL